MYVYFTLPPVVDRIKPNLILILIYLNLYMKCYTLPPVGASSLNMRGNKCIT